MKRALVTIALAVLLTVPAAAFAERVAPGSGSLVVQNAAGSLYVNAKGGIIGRFDQGSITVFDPVTIRDVATFERPNRYAAGIRHVFVNGRRVVADGSITSERPGRPLRGPGAR